jgi:hypothetical protein
MRASAALAGMLLAWPVLAAAAPPLRQNGWTIYQDSHTELTIPCLPTPILLRGSHTDVVMKGGCGYVRLEGEHNDVEVDLAPGATFEITGSHNDVTWRQVAPGPPPRLLDTGAGNSFHRPG